MRIASGYHNGIGNWVIYTSVLQALQWHSKNKVTLILDDNWRGEVRDGIELLANNSPFIEKIISYQEEYNRDDYDLTYMTAHSVLDDGLYRELFTMTPDPNAFTSWASSYLSELDFYYLELYRQLDYKGPIFPQYVPSYSDFEKSPFLYDLRASWEIKICISNGWRRSPENRMESKNYPHWLAVMNNINNMYEDVKFVLVGGRDDMQWGKEIRKNFSEKNCLDFTGKTNLLETIGIIQSCDLTLSTDTGVFHLADSLKVPGVVAFSSTLHSKNGPINGTIVPIRSPIELLTLRGDHTFLNVPRKSTM